MAKNFQLIHLTIDKEHLNKASNRLRNQFVGCMHAHNELTILNRLLVFTMNDTGNGELHDSAQSVQMWFILQLLSAKLFETWVMLTERFLQRNPPDVVGRLEPAHKASLEWLIHYFGNRQPFKSSALKIIRDKTAFHYDRINITEAAANLAASENGIYLAQHPANSLYYMGSALVFRAAFAMIADKAEGTANGSHEERVHKGTKIALDNASEANSHMHAVLYGLIKLLIDDVLGQPAANEQQVRINVLDAPAPERVSIPAFIDID
ncbi:hypothetical protein [Ensifer aridi]|uniref:hypothetical protein n=1 Tax=Ensifer aridi TaxID=1708715 RepID=UPI00358F5AB3